MSIKLSKHYTSFKYIILAWVHFYSVIPNSVTEASSSCYVIRYSPVAILWRVAQRGVYTAQSCAIYISRSHIIEEILNSLSRNTPWWANYHHGSFSTSVLHIVISLCNLGSRNSKCLIRETYRSCSISLETSTAFYITTLKTDSYNLKLGMIFTITLAQILLLMLPIREYCILYTLYYC